jgi:hypothetical protein
VNIPRYRRLLHRAVQTVLEPITGLDVSWLTQVLQLTFETFRNDVALLGERN